MQLCRRESTTTMSLQRTADGPNAIDPNDPNTTSTNSNSFITFNQKTLIRHNRIIVPLQVAAW